MVTAGVIELGLSFRKAAAGQMQHVGHDRIRLIATGRRDLYTWLGVMAF